MRPRFGLAAAAIAAAALAGCATAGGMLGAGEMQPWERAPLWATPSHGPPKALVVWYSGDGGWGRADRTITPILAAHGLPVVDVNTRRYFWKRRSLQEAASDLDHVIDRYARLWGTQQVVLVGYSFGGGAIPLIAPHLSQANRARISRVVLLAPISKGQLVLRPWTWLGLMQPEAQPVTRLVKASPAPVSCIIGAEDHIGVCPDDPAVMRTVLDSGHTFKGEAAPLEAAEAILRSAGVATARGPLGGGSAAS